MGYNYGIAKKNFDYEWERNEKWYRECGMSDEAIAQMRDFDFENFKRDRIIREREQPLIDIVNDLQSVDCEVEVLELKTKFMPMISVNDTYHYGNKKYGWIEEIEDDPLRAFLTELADMDKELLTFLLYGYTKTEIGKMMGIERKTVTRHIQSIAEMIEQIRSKSKLAS